MPCLCAVDFDTYVVKCAGSVHMTVSLSSALKKIPLSNNFHSFLFAAPNTNCNELRAKPQKGRGHQRIKHKSKTFLKK